ncbi:AraC family transcriptional regulator [Aliiruegeria haliotis]|uniref:AraC family transcriptional regulator n=1 Tax=Aliiruegeria haliotis TaxID=1280846 RepID=UPI001304CCB1|nr:helix-turn-helix domain-containing protein [Aliiruegeria haliotis]
MSLRRVGSYTDHLRQMPVREYELTQFGVGELAVKAAYVWGRDCVVEHVNWGPESASCVFGDADWVGLTVPLKWYGEYKLNGFVGHPGDAYFLDGREEWSTQSTDRNVLFIALSRAVFQSTLAQLCGVPHFELPRGHRMLQLKPEALCGYSVLCAHVFAQAQTDATDPAHAVLDRPSEARFFSAVAQWFLDADFIRQARCAHNRRAVDQVRAARDVINKITPEELSIARLCDAAGIGKSQLHEAFNEVFGHPPWQFVQYRRLTAVRECLLYRPAPPRSVKDAALQFGYTSGGRFAREYKAQFGELPSETLRHTIELGARVHRPDGIAGFSGNRR